MQKTKKLRLAGVAISGVVALLLVLSCVLALPAEAEGAQTADCLITVSIHLTPGVTLVPRSGIESSEGERGTISCTGSLDGHRITGPGTFGWQGNFTQITCLFDGRPLAATYSLTVPTDAGIMHFSGVLSD